MTKQTPVKVVPGRGYTWSLLILPYIEQQNVYTAINPDISTPGSIPTYATAPGLQAIMQNSPSTYRCPSDPIGTPLNTVLSRDGNGNGDQYGRNNYVCNRSVLGPNNNNDVTVLSIQTISDGSSNTILVGERDSFKVPGAVWGARTSTTASYEGRIGRKLNASYADGPTPQTLPANNVNYAGADDCRRLGFTSAHTGGINFVFGDGSVHFIRDAAEINTGANFCQFDVITPTVGTPNAAYNTVMQKLEHPSDGIPLNGDY